MCIHNALPSRLCTGHHLDATHEPPEVGTSTVPLLQMRNSGTKWFHVCPRIYSQAGAQMKALWLKSLCHKQHPTEAVPAPGSSQAPALPPWDQAQYNKAIGNSVNRVELAVRTGTGSEVAATSASRALHP